MKLIGLIVWIQAGLACKCSYLPYLAKEIYLGWSAQRPAAAPSPWWSAYRPATPFFTPSCTGSSDFCNETGFYPAQEIVKAVELQGRVFKTLFDNPKPAEDSDSNHRKSGQEDSMENVCATITNHIYRPRVAKNIQGKYMFIVNTDQADHTDREYIQLVPVSVCLDADQECLGGSLFGGGMTSCRQQYSEHKLVAVDGDNGQVVVDTFRFPSCCSCHFRNIYQI